MRGGAPNLCLRALEKSDALIFFERRKKNEDYHLAFYNTEDVDKEHKGGKSMLVIPEKFVDKCIENFKETDQRQILEEECAELIQAISKNIRGKPNSIDQIKEEMTHVLISINVVARKLGISQSDILNEISKKCNKYGWDVDWNQK